MSAQSACSDLLFLMILRLQDVCIPFSGIEYFMGIGCGIGCNKCSYKKSFIIGVGMSHSSLEAEIESTNRNEQLQDHHL